MSNFKVGEKVVCVEPIDGLVKNEIYTIETTTSIGVSLLEQSPAPPCIWFYKWRFRKLDHQFSEDVIAEIIKQVKEESLTLAN